MALSESEELELLELRRRRLAANVEPSLQSQVPQMAQDAARSAVMGPYDATKKFFETDPATMQRVGGQALPIVGGAMGGPIGAAGGEFARQMTGTALAPDTVPKTGLGRAASVISAGVTQEPKILEAIPGVPVVKDMASKMLSKTGKGLAKTAQAFSGGKAGDFLEAAKKGYNTYLAPSMEKAGETFKTALANTPGESVVPSMVEHMQSAVTPEGSAANKFLLDMAGRLDKGELIDARQALKAKQALDDVIDTVPSWQIKRRGKLFDLKSTFDDVLSSQSGELKAASNEYRAASLKRNLLKFMPVNKNGQYSRLAPMLSSLAAGAGAGLGSKNVKTGAGATAGYLLATSPLAMGLGATTAGTFGQLAARPEARLALLGILRQMQMNKDQGQPQ